MSRAEQLISMIENRSARVGVIGAGYVGLPLLGVFHDAGFPVVALDVDSEKVRMLRSGDAYIRHLGDDFHRRLAASDRFEATDDFSRLGSCDCVLVCVPTPLAEDRTPDLRYVLQSAREIAASLRPGQLVCLESTTYPGTTRDVFLPELRAGAPGLVPDRDFHVCYSPERENPGDLDHTTRTIPKVIGAIGADSLRAACALYGAAVETVVPVDSCEIAEASKLLENVFRAVNIALVNECKLVFEAMGVDVWEVIRASATKPFGFMAFSPGPGLGGHCIPVDPFYLAHRAREVGRESRFIELAGEVNSAMPRHVVDRLALALAERGTPMDGARVLVLGVAYKPDIDDVRESPSFVIMEEIESRGATVEYSDPHIARTWPMRRHSVVKSSVALDARGVRGFDALVLCTAHRAFDYEMIAANAHLVIDTRDAFRAYEAAMGDRLVRA